MTYRDLLVVVAYIAAGGMAGLAFLGPWLLAWLGLAMLAWATRLSSSATIVVTGSYLGGLLFNILALRWLFGASVLLLPLALVHVLALGWPVVSLLVRHLNLPLSIRFPIAWTIGIASPVWLTSALCGPSGHFYMNRLAQTQLDIPVVQVADVSGIAAVEFVMAAVAAGLVEMITVRRLPFGATLLLIASCVYGSIRLQHETEHEIQLALHSKLFDGMTPVTTVVDLAVWPEEAMRREQDEHEWSRLVQALGSPIIAGVRRKRGGMLFNSIAVADGTTVKYHDKHFLVMGAEAPSPLDWLVKAKRRAGLCVIGHQPQLLKCRTLKLAVPICYEITIPQSITGRPDLIVNPGSELRIANGDGTAAMLDHARLRAIEARRTVVRATIAGKTAIIDGSGRVLETRTGETLFGVAALDRRNSAYAVLGDWITMGSIAVVVVLAARSSLNWKSTI